MPKHPEQETAFLPFPKRGNNVMNGQGSGGVRIGVVVFKKMKVNDDEQHAKNTKN